MTLSQTSQFAGQSAPDVTCSLGDHIARGGSLRDILPFSEVDDESLYALGYGLYGQASYALAMPIFALLVAREGADPRFNAAYAACLHMQDRHELAIKYYLTAFILDPANPALIFHVCECLLATGQQGPARQFLDVVEEMCEAGLHDPILKKAQGLSALLDAAIQTPKEGSLND